MNTHFSLKEKEKLLEKVLKAEASKTLANILDELPFSQISRLVEIIREISKGKK
jgi:hypothetical protein